MTRKRPPNQLKIDPAELTQTAEQLRQDATKYRDALREQEQSEGYHKRYDDEQKILIVIDAKHMGAKEAAAKYGIPKTLINDWTKRLDTDEIFRQAFMAKDYQIKNDFERETSDSIKACLDFIKRAAQSCDVNNPAQIRAVAGAMKMAAEFRLAQEITYARLGKDKPTALANPNNPDRYVLESRFQTLEDVNEGHESAISPQPVIVEGDFE